jgi:RNA polymerase sigma-70 factor, ECF subfamily
VISISGGANARTDREGQLKAQLLASRSGDAAAHHAFLAAVAGPLRAFFRAKLGGAAADAEDLLQETLIALHTRRDSFDPRYPASAWIYAIARYRLIDHLRRVRRRGVSVPVEDVEGVLFAQSDAEASDAQRDVAHLLKALPAKQQEAIRLTKLEDLSVKDAADRLGLTVSDVKISVHRGLKTLMRLMGEEPGR